MPGAVQIVVFDFPSVDDLRVPLLDELEALTPADAVRFIDALVVMKEADGTLVALEASELGPDVDDLSGLLIGELLGFAIEGDPADPPSSIDSHGALIGAGIADVRAVGHSLARGCAALFLLIEHSWAEGLQDAIRSAGGVPRFQGFLTLDALVMIGAEVEAIVEAIVATEAADALTAEALARSVEALATAEVAPEVEAAVAARTISALVDAGILDPADAGDAITAVLDDETLERAAAR